jgi:DNA invertase Pin-like site-specific DNA recombinase
MFQIIGAMAEFERALIAERVRAGMRNARAKGRRIGRPSHVPITDALRAQMVGAYEHGEGSLRVIARRFATSLGTVQRCVGPHHVRETQLPSH